MPLLSKRLGLDVRHSSVLNQIPFLPDSEFWLTGKVTKVGETYYAISAKNGYVFPLSAAPDWDTSLNILPFKTAVTISAPANGTQAATTLQAIDINHFWYAADGTANIIPFTAFSNGDVDFEHKLFAKILEQTTHDETQLEKTPAGISNIAHYNTIKSGSDLTKCQTHFNSSAEDASAYWVTKSGSDSSPTGNKAAPYLTIEKAYKTAPSGSTIYVKTGNYTEEYNGTSIRYFYCDRIGTWNIKGLGLNEIKTIGTTAVIKVVNGILNFHNFILNGETSHTSIVDYFPNTNTFKAYKCVFKAPATNNVLSLSNAAVNTFEAYDSIFTDFKIVTCYDSAKIKRCLVNAPVRFVADGEYHYNKHYYNTYNASAAINGCSSVKWSDFTSKSPAIIYSGANAVDHSYNRFTVNWSASIGSSLLVHSIDNTSCVPTIIGNIYNSESVENTDRITFLYVASCLTPTIKDNIYKSLSRVKFDHVNIVATANVTGKVIFKGNFSHSNSSDSGIGISIGGETSFNNKHDESEITENTFIGSLLLHPTESCGTVHGLLFSGGKNATIRYNTFSYMNLACVIKTGGIVDTYTKNGIGYNRFINNNVDCWIRGIKGLLIHNNSIQFNNGFTGISPQYKIVIDANTPVSATNYSEDVLIKNCVIENKSNIDVELIHLDSHALSNGCKAIKCTVNNYGAGNYIINTYGSLVDTNAAGLTENCADADPLFNAELIPSSPISGIDLGTDYDDGIDITSTFGSDTTLPVIVTRQQPSTWQQGAFILAM